MHMRLGHTRRVVAQGPGGAWSPTPHMSIPHTSAGTHCARFMPLLTHLQSALAFSLFIPLPSLVVLARRACPLPRRCSCPPPARLPVALAITQFWWRGNEQTPRARTASRESGCLIVYYCEAPVFGAARRALQGCCPRSPARAASSSAPAEVSSSQGVTASVFSRRPHRGKLSSTGTTNPN
jgi:hypothetical protein